MANDSPAYLGDWLAEQGVPVALFDTSAGQDFPGSLAGYGALAILGGEMSANDDLPSLRMAEALVREAVRDAVPTLGHCLGGQLMARALGARVTASPAPEIGWQPLRVEAHEAARAWLGDADAHTVFHWHYEAFELPAGATRLAGSAACPNQAFALGPHLAMQFHIEIDAAKLQRWSLDDSAPYRQAQQQHPASVQGPAAMREAAARHLAAHQALARRIYGRWLGLASAR